MTVSLTFALSRFPGDFSEN